MSGSKDAADTAPSDIEVPTEEDAYTDQGAPSDVADQDTGEGSRAG